MEEEINYNMLMTKELYEKYNKLNEEFKAAQDSLKEQYYIRYSLYEYYKRNNRKKRGEKNLIYGK